MIRKYQKGTSNQLSQNFNSLEFDCHCSYPDCTITYIDSDLIDYLQAKRDKVGQSFKVNSGFRCTRHNHEEGGKPGSIHLVGKAADIVVSGMAVHQMALLFSDADGLGIYLIKGFVHVDKRGYRARWNG